jgi:hypothetical protein
MKINRIYIVVVIFIVLIIGYEGCQKNPIKKIVQMKGEYICISLVNYMSAVNEKIAAKETLPGEMETLYGMSWIDGYVLEPAHNDIILVGKKIKNRPVFHLEVYSR